MSNHLSRLALDHALANVAPEQRHPHLGGCERCAARLALMQRDYDAFLARFPTLEALQLSRPVERPERASGWSIGWPLGLAGALVTALLLVMFNLGTNSPAPPPQSGVRPKGGSIVDLAVRRGGRSLRYEDSLQLRAGDVLAFRYTTQRRHLLLLSLERSGKVNAYLTDPSRRYSMRVRPGRDVHLGLGVELDDYVGPERVIALLSDRPLDVEAVRHAVLQRFRSLAGDDRDRLELGKLPVDAEQISWLIDKGGRQR
jgi:hypothetical protein